MSVLSKSVSHTCYEVGHVWNPSCTGAAKDVFVGAFKFSFKTYLTFYTLTALLKRRGLQYYLQKLLPQTLQSTIMLTTNGYAFIAAFCVLRHGLGKFTALHGVLSGIVASFLAILHERKSRRGMLALYMSNIAVELLWNMLTSRGIVKSVPNGEVYLFALVSAGYMYLYRRAGGLDKSTSNAIKFVVGDADVSSTKIVAFEPQVHADKQTASPNGYVQRNGTKRPSSLTRAEMVVKWLNSLMSNKVILRYLALKHNTCQHQCGCAIDVVYQGLKMLSLGVAIQSILTLLTKITKIINKPSLIKTLLFSKANIQLAAFLTSFAVIFKSVNCALRWLFNGDSEYYGAAAGLLAGLSMYNYKSKAIMLYLGSKLVEHLYFKGITNGHLPYFPNADILIYTLSTGFMFHGAIFEPHNLRPQYWSFLKKLVQGKFALFNRHLLDPFGMESSKLFKEYWPKYDPRFTALKKPF